MNPAAPGQGAAPPTWVEGGGPQQAIDRGRPRGSEPSDAAAVWAAALEHEARGLLNLVALASRCAERSADEGEREHWGREVCQARERLEGLYVAGLPRDFLKEPAV